MPVPGGSSSRLILLADMESFYASVEVARNPALRGKPVIVCGDPGLRHGITLAATREAKVRGVKAGLPPWECRRLCPDAVFVRPNMALYLETSLRITRIFEGYTDRVLPYSIDEQFLDLTGCSRLFGPAAEAARGMIERVHRETGIRCRIGIGENLLQAKMACDCFAKKNDSGIFELTGETYAHHVWPLPVRNLFGVGMRLEQRLNRMGIRTVGHLAAFPREALAWRWGINGEILWLNAHGVDYSTVVPGAVEGSKGVGHTMTLPRDYGNREEIRVVLLEMTEEVCRRARTLGRLGTAVHVYCRGAGYRNPTGFARRRRLPAPTASTMEVFPHVLALFAAHWDRLPVRRVGMGLAGLVPAGEIQLSLLGDSSRERALAGAMDRVRERFGAASLFRAASLSPGAQLFQRANLIGGHRA